MGHQTTLSLYDGAGRRLYINAQERDALIWAASKADPVRRSFALVLIHTGCRISEALALRPSQIDIAGRAIIFRTLKKRSEKPVFRSVPVPLSLTAELIRTFSINPKNPGEQRLWPVTRNTAYLWIKDLMSMAGIPPGPHCSPKGLRHGFGVHAVLSGVNLNQLRDWLGHADIATTSLYLRVLGPEERRLASRMWRASPLQWRRWLPPLMIGFPVLWESILCKLKARKPDEQ